MNDLCISIRSLKRATYLKACLHSLEANVDLDTVDFYLLQDGGINPWSGNEYAREEEIEESLKVFEESSLPNKTTYQSKWNMGCANQKYHQLTTLFPRYKYVVLVDNDLVFNRYYIKTLKVLFEQFKGTPAGSIQTSFRHDGSNFQEGQIAKMLENKVTSGFSHRWEFGLWRETWNHIRSDLERYFKYVSRCDFKQLIDGSARYGDLKELLELSYGTVHADEALENCIEWAGYRGLHTLSLRHKTIGKQGIYSFEKDRFEREGFGKIRLFQVGNVDKYGFVEPEEIMAGEVEEFSFE